MLLGNKWWEMRIVQAAKVLKKVMDESGLVVIDSLGESVNPLFRSVASPGVWRACEELWPHCRSFSMPTVLSSIVFVASMFIQLLSQWNKLSQPVWGCGLIVFCVKRPALATTLLRWLLWIAQWEKFLNVYFNEYSWKETYMNMYKEAFTVTPQQSTHPHHI